MPLGGGGEEEVKGKQRVQDLYPRLRLHRVRVVGGKNYGAHCGYSVKVGV